MRSLIERLKRLFERKQYWLVIGKQGPNDFNAVIDESPAVFLGKHYGAKIVLVSCLRISRSDFDLSEKAKTSRIEEQAFIDKENAEAYTRLVNAVR